jgi:predicted SAM-dependent methyltransferase
MNSFYGRMFLNKKPVLTAKENFLHLGCGSYKIPGWINADFYHGMKFWKKYPNKPDWMLDLRYPLKCDDCVWDGVFSEHTLEHLYPLHALNLLKELLRTIKKSCWLRIAVPDLRKYVEYYYGNKNNPVFKDRWPTGCEAIRSLTQSNSHLSVWDSNLLGRFLQEAGFVNINVVAFKKGTDTRLLEEHEERMWETLYIEAQKPC